MMNRHNEAAALLLSVRRRQRTRLDGLPEVLRPRSDAEAYGIQRAVAAELGAIGGWKVGSPAPTATQFTCAPIPAAAVFDDGATVEGSDRVVEAEIAVRIGRDLPPRDTPYTVADIGEAIASAHPAIEVLETRFADLDRAGALCGLADSSSNHSLVVGPAIVDWRNIDLAAETVRLLAGDAEIKRGTGNPGGEMLRLVAWLANEGARWAGGLRAGQVVTTGSWTGKDPVPAGVDVVAQFAHCGAAAVRFAP